MEKRQLNFFSKLNLFVNLGKYHATQGCLCTIIVTKKELSDPQQINDALYNF